MAKDAQNFTNLVGGKADVFKHIGGIRVLGAGKMFISPKSNVESKSLEVATTCSSQTLGLDSLTRTVSLDNAQDLIGKSEDTMNQIAAHAQTCATLRIKIKSLKNEAALAEQVNSNSGKLCECMKSFESSMTRVAVISITSMLNDVSLEENRPGQEIFLDLTASFARRGGA